MLESLPRPRRRLRAGLHSLRLHRHAACSIWVTSARSAPATSARPTSCAPATSSRRPSPSSVTSARASSPCSSPNNSARSPRCPRPSAPSPATSSRSGSTSKAAKASRRAPAFSQRSISPSPSSASPPGSSPPLSGASHRSRPWWPPPRRRSIWLFFGPWIYAVGAVVLAALIFRHPPRKHSPPAGGTGTAHRRQESLVPAISRLFVIHVTVNNVTAKMTIAATTAPTNITSPESMSMSPFK